MQYRKNVIWKKIFLKQSNDIFWRYQTKMQYSVSKMVKLVDKMK